MNRRYVTPEQARQRDRERCREYNLANKSGTRLRHVWNSYRLSAVRYGEMLAAGCAICPADFASNQDDVDHDHKCDHPERGIHCCERCVRGLLCRRCNLRVGAYERGQNSDADIAAYLGREQSAIMMQVALF